MKKLFSILVCVFLSLGSLWAEGSATINVYAVCDDDGDGKYTQGGGTVQASAKNCNTGSVWNGYVVSDNEGNSSVITGCGADGYSIFGSIIGRESYYLQATRKSTSQNYYFVGWFSGTAQGPNLSSSLGTGDTYKKDYAYNGTGDLYVYAVFKKIINPRQSSISWTKTTETATLETEVALYKATNFQVASITCNGNTNNSSFTCTPSSTTTSDGNITLTLTAGVDVKDGDKFVITLTSDNNGFATITVEILTKIQAQFAPPAKGKGSYKAVRTSSDGGTTCELDQNSVAHTATLDEVSDFYHTLTAVPAEGYRFYRWVIEDAAGKTYFMTNPYNYTVKNGDRISVEFLPNGVAQFIVKGEDGVYYYELDAAIAAAQNSTSKTVVVSENGLLSLENKTANSDGKYEFTIPAGITLLVPGDAAYTVQNKGVGENDIAGKTSTSSVYRKLILQNNTSIVAYGNICVYSKLSDRQGDTGRPYQYGQIEMGGNCQITMKSGSVLTAFGYISGNIENSCVVAESGATVYEVFQFIDYRGGQATMGAYKNSYKIFPLSQYYVQNIETKLIIYPGATEKVSSAIDAPIIGTVCVNMNLITKSTTDEDQGFLCLGDNTKLTKWYDAKNDRQKFVVEGDKGATGAKAKISYMNISVTALDLDSRNYILPISNNIDISINNVTLNSPFSVCFLAGSTVTIDKDAELVVDEDVNIFLYDKEPVYDGTNTYEGFVYSGNVLIRPIKYTIASKEFTRTAENTLDASFIVNGKLTVNGALYTTTYGSNITDATIQQQNYGANITSNGGGEVVFNKKGTGNVTYQYLQEGTSLTAISIPITNARLRNADKSFSAGENASEGDRYIYYNDIDGGKWSVPASAATRNNIPELRVTLPTASDTQNAEFKLRGSGLSVNDFTVSIEGANFTKGEIFIDGDKLKVPITYTAQNKQGSATATLTLRYDPENLTLSETITATEDYNPDFSVSSTSLAFDPIYVDETAEQPLIITPISQNVTTLSEGENMVWSGVITGDDKDEFEFIFGEGEDKLSGAKVVYHPRSSGEKSATLRLTATYTDAFDASVSDYIDVLLTARANLYQNTLAFAKFPDEIIAGITSDFKLFDGETNNAKTEIATKLSENGVIEIIQQEGEYYVKVLSEGTVTITATQQGTTTIEGCEISKSITVKPKDVLLSRVPLCIDTKDEFIIHTVTNATNGASYLNNNTIKFPSTETTSSEWIFQFMGIPNQLTFTPIGSNNWNIEERASSTESWSSVVTWTTFVEGTEVVLSLKPTTRQIRIQYGAGQSGDASISNLCVSALTIKADVDKLYLPENGISKEVKFIHTAIPLSISEVDGVMVGEPSLENKGTDAEPYYETTVTLLATQADKEVTLTASVADANSSITIRTYAFPQELPIKLAQDDAERYYFVTTASAYTQWDATNRQIVFQNPGAQLTRYVTFAFNGAPSEIRFTTSADINSSDWVIKESEDGVVFTEASVDKRIVEGTSFKQQLNYTTRYLSIEYVSRNLSEVAISNLVMEGFPMAWATPEQLALSDEQKEASFVLTTVNLKSIKVVLDSEDFVLTHGSSEAAREIVLSEEDYANALGVNKVGEIAFNVKWITTGNVNQSMIYVYNNEDDELLTTVKIIGAKNVITNKDVATGIYTGVAKGYTSLIGAEYSHHEVSLKNAFDGNGKALFDYIIIYGATKTDDGSTEITQPTSSDGSNALTPYYVYRKAQSSETSGSDSYLFVELVENANMSDKVQIDGFTTTVAGTTYIDVDGSLSVYITGFAPYATTGMTKDQEGVWLFRGENGEKLDVYLENCYIYSRNKTKLGVPMNRENKEHSEFTEDVALGSGAVLVFENEEISKNLDEAEPFRVNIHTIGNNIFKSNYGSFYKVFGMRAYQISAPLHIHMKTLDHVNRSKTELTLDDIWPTKLGENGEVLLSDHTNGFLSLQKQSNNAPSIDLGNEHSVVNFRGGRVELQNAQIVSPNYKTTLAISYRSGKYGADDLNLRFAYGIGTDAVGGTVYFYDGTTTVLPMVVDAKYRQYYLMDTEPVIDEDGKPVLDSEGNPVLQESNTTTCLRCPQHTYVYGGSQCFMRACSHVTSKGGAPTDGHSLLGQYIYTYDETQGDSKDDNGLLTAMRFPGGVKDSKGKYLSDYYEERGYLPIWESVAPDADGKVYFWIPDDFGGVDAEEDKLLTTWKTCMTEIRAGYGGKEGGIGGDASIELTEEVKYLLYCQIDENIHEVISAGDKDALGNNINYFYEAPVEVPSVGQEALGEYTTISPTYVGNTTANEVLSEGDYVITDKVYYITTATADVWMTFTAPFNVEKIWVVETYSETELEALAKQIEEANKSQKYVNPREAVLKEQAKHNADFAAFFGVAMALGSTDDFETIFNDWKKWGIAEDKKALEGGTALYSGTGEYTLRGKYELTPYTEGNWATANFYLNKNNGSWSYDENGDFVPAWEIPTITNGVLLEKGETYSLLFPYCVGCWEKDERENVLNREYWDYWSGKFLIFEGKQGEQTVLGSNVFDDIFADEDELTDTDKAILHGNNTFAFMTSEVKDNVLLYSASPALEGFLPAMDQEMTILPTQSFLLLPSESDDSENIQILSVSRMGKIKYRPTSEDNGGGITTDEDHVPTINGGSDIFVTSVAEGINIAVSEPQAVGVFSATGQLIYSGWVETSVDVNLATNGVYVIVGENETVKAIFRQTP